MMQSELEYVFIKLMENKMKEKSLRGQAHVLTPDEFKKLLSNVSENKHGRRNSLLMLFSFGFGLRAIEMASLKLNQVIDENDELIETVKLQRTKGQKARSIFIVDERIKKALKEYIRERKMNAIKNGKIFSLSQPLFLSQKGSHFNNKTMQKLFEKIYLTAGIEASSHSGRRTFATNLIEKGMDIRAVQLLMGHENINSTARYVNDNPERLKRIMLDALY